MSTLFISHSSQDNEISKEMERRLAEQNHSSVFLDLDPEKGIVAGQSWERTLYRKLRACRAVIVLCTDNYLTSHWCFAEIALARMEGKHILALQVDPLSPDAKLPSILTEKQFIDLRTNTEEGYERLWRGLREMDLLGVSNEWDPRQSPYLGLSAYQEQHAPVFFGRDDETRVGLELLDRGAPGLVMVLGASGSGKSSMVRAGMVPRLRKEKDRWLVVGPFRPRRDPFAELADSLVDAYQSYAPDEARSAETRERIRALRGAGASSGISAENASDDGEHAEDQRLQLLLKQLEELRRSPPQAGGSPLQDFLDWSLDDLRQICGEQSREQVAEAPQAEALPLVEIADHLRRASGHREARVLLVIDQFEELLGHEDYGDDANRFLDLLRTALETEHSPLMVLGTMRSDFLGLFQRNRALLGIDFESLSVGPMSVDGMRRVIEEPAKLGAIELEKGLADSLLEDTETPDALPLLSFTLSVLWKGRQHGTLTVHQYQELDGLHGAVAREAEAVLELARKQEKEDDVRRAFLQMARLTEDGSYARQPVSWDREEIRTVQPILEDFEKRRLLVTRMEKGEQRTVEVAHEALFRSWTPLKTWLDDHRGELLLEAQLRRDAKAWEEHNRSADNLWRGGRLQQAAELLRKGELGNGGTDRTPEENFVRAGVRRRRIQLGTLAGITVCIFAVLAGFLGYALWAKGEAERLRIEAEKQTIIAQAVGAKNLLSTKPAEGVVAAIISGAAAMQTFSTEETPLKVRSSLLEALQLVREGGVERNAWVAHGGETVTSVAISGDGQTIVSSGWDSKVRIWDGVGDSIAVMDHDQVTSVAVTKDGKLIISAGFKSIRVWNQKGKQLSEFVERSIPGPAVAVSENGKQIVSVGSRMVRLWDSQLKSSDKLGEVRTGTGMSGRVPTIALSGDGLTTVCGSSSGLELWDRDRKHTVLSADPKPAVSVDHDGQTIVTGGSDGAVRVWKGDGTPIGQPLRGHDGQVASIDVSDNGLTIVSGGWDGTVRLWSRNNGKANGRILNGHVGRVASVALSADGGTIVSGGDDGIVRVWEHRSKPSRGHDDRVFSAVVSPDRQTVLSAGKDGKVLLWDPLGAPRGKFLSGPFDEITCVGQSPESNWIVIGHSSGALRLWDEQGMVGGKAFHGRHKGPVTSVAVCPSSETIVSGSEDGTVRLWDRQGQPKGQPLSGHGGRVSYVAASRDGQTIVGVGADGKLLRWDLRASTQGTSLGFLDMVTAIAVGDDGQHVVSGHEDGQLKIWDGEGKHIRTIKDSWSQEVTCVALSPDGQSCIRGAPTGYVQLWKLDEEKPITELIKADGLDEDDPSATDVKVTSVAFSDGKTIVIRDEAGSTWRWEEWEQEGKGTHTRQPGGSPQPARVTSIAFSEDGETVVSGRSDGTLRLWDQKATSELLFDGRHEGSVTALAVSRDGNVIVSGDEHGAVGLWNRQCKPIRIHSKGHYRSVTSVATSSNGKTIVSGGSDGKVLRWNLQGTAVSPPLIEAFSSGTGVYVAVSPDGQTIVTGGERGMLRLRNLDGSDDWTLKGHEESVMCVAFSPDAETIISGSGGSRADGTIRLWDRLGKPIGRPFKGSGRTRFTAVALSSDGKILVSGDVNGNVVVRQIDIETFLREACDWLRYHRALTSPETEAERQAAKIAKSLSEEPEG